MSTVYIMVGISGSGKSTIASELIDAHRQTKVCSTDLAMYDADGNYSFDPAKLPQAHATSLTSFVEALQADVHTIVVDNTNCSMHELAPYAALATSYNAELTIVVVHANPKICIERNQHGTPANAIMGQYYRLQKMLADMPPWWNVEHRFNNDESRLPTFEEAMRLD